MAELLAGKERVKVLDAMRLSLSVRLARLDAERLGRSIFEVPRSAMLHGAAVSPPGSLTGDGVGIAEIDTLVACRLQSTSPGWPHARSLQVTASRWPNLTQLRQAPRDS